MSIQILINCLVIKGVPRYKSVRSIDPNRALSEITELSRQLRAMRKAVVVEGERDEGRWPPPAVLRTRRVTVVQEESLVTWEKE